MSPLLLEYVNVEEEEEEKEDEGEGEEAPGETVVKNEP